MSKTIVFLGADLAKNVFALHGVNATGRACPVRPSVLRDQLLESPQASFIRVSGTGSSIRDRL
jgi:hypothetical protein